MRIGVVLLLIVGCAPTAMPREIIAQRGQFEPGHYSATIRVVPRAWIAEQCGKPALACARSVTWDRGTSVFLVFPHPSDATVTQRHVDVATHELCHAIAAAEGRSHEDNEALCHREDGGHIE